MFAKDLSVFARSVACAFISVFFGVTAAASTLDYVIDFDSLTQAENTAITSVTVGSGADMVTVSFGNFFLVKPGGGDTGFGNNNGTSAVNLPGCPVGIGDTVCVTPSTSLAGGAASDTVLLQAAGGNTAAIAQFPRGTSVNGSISFSRPVDAVEFALIDVDINDRVAVDAFQGGVTTDDFTVVGTVNNGNYAFGLTGTGITELDLRFFRLDTLPVAVGFDVLSFTIDAAQEPPSTAVTGPASIGLIIAGLPGLALMRRLLRP